MNAVLDIAQIVSGFGILVAIIYAAWQFREAKDGREATFLASAVAQSPTEITIEMGLVKRGLREGMLTCDKFCDLPEGRKQFLLDPLKMFDMIGWMVSTGAVRLKSVINHVGADVIIRSRDLYRPFAEDARKHVGHYLFLYYENLAQQVIGWNKTPAGRFRSKSRQETSWDGCPTRLKKVNFRIGNACYNNVI